MRIKENNMEYNIIVCNTNSNILFMIQYIKNYLKITQKKYIGIDFEFNRENNKRVIALCQINFEVKNDKTHYIFLFYPPDIQKLNNNILVELFTSKNTIKILHGSESLDIPYLFSEILININDKNDFLVNFYDTKYMCEYYNISNNFIQNKCKIYELLYQMNVITKNKLNMLNTNDKNMGNIWEIDIKINKLSKNVILYSLYDVIYLPELFKKFPKNYIYRKLLPSINNFNLIYKISLINTLTNISANIAKYNTNYYIIDQKKYSFNEIYTIIYYWFDSDKFFNNIFQLNYFKKSYEIFIKDTLYRLLTMRQAIDVNQKNKRDIYSNNLYKLLKKNNDIILLSFISKISDKISEIF
jgi:hypothetical protein